MACTKFPQLIFLQQYYLEQCTCERSKLVGKKGKKKKKGNWTCLIGRDKENKKLDFVFAQIAK